MKFILGDNKLKVIEEEMIRESYSDKVELCKKFLDNNFIRAAYDKHVKGGKIGSINVFVQLNGKKLPTKVVRTASEVFDVLQNEFLNIIGDRKERDGFLRQVIKDWYNKKITKNGSLSSYKF